MRVFIAGYGWKEFPAATAYWVDDESGMLTLTDLGPDQNTFRRRVGIFPDGAWLALASFEPGKDLHRSPIGRFTPSRGS